MARGDYYQGISRNNPFSRSRTRDDWEGLRGMMPAPQQSPMPMAQPAPAASPMDMTSRVKPYNPIMDPSGPLAQAGWIGALVTGLGGGQTRQQHQQSQQGALLADASQFIQEKAPSVGASQALLAYMNTPNGMNFMANGGDMEQLGKIAKMAEGNVLGQQRAAVFNEVAQAPTGGDQWAGMRAEGDAPPRKMQLTPEDYLKAASKFTAMNDDEGARLATSLAEQSRHIEALRKPPTTDELKEYDRYVQQETEASRQPMSWFDYQVQLKSVGAQRTIINPEDAKLKGLVEADVAKVKAADEIVMKIQQVEPLLDEAERLSKSAPGGYAGMIAAQMAKVADALGIEVKEGWSDAEALNAIAMQLVPLVRQPGQVSNYEQISYLKAVPGLLQSKDGRQKIIGMIRKQIKRAEEVANVYRETIGADPATRKAAMAKLDKPMFDEKEKAAMDKALARADSPDGIPSIADDKDFDDLMPGTVFRDPTGQLRTKPAEAVPQQPSDTKKPVRRVGPVFMPEPANPKKEPRTRAGGSY